MGFNSGFKGLMLSQALFMSSSSLTFLVMTTVHFNQIPTVPQRPPHTQHTR